MESLIKKFQTLQNKTTTSGCTEQEALHAAEKVAELLDKYGLSIEPDGSGKEPLGCGDVPALAQEKVDRSTSFIHCAIEVHPLAFDLDIGLVHTPGVAHRSRILVPALFKVRHVPLAPIARWSCELARCHARP